MLVAMRLLLVCRSCYANELRLPARGTFHIWWTRVIDYKRLISAYGPKRTCRNTQSMSLLGVKRTCRFALHMSAFDPKRTRRQNEARLKFDSSRDVKCDFLGLHLWHRHCPLDNEWGTYREGETYSRDHLLYRILGF